MSTTAILTAAGSGSRLGAELPKALVPIVGKPMVRIAAENLFMSDAVDELVVTVPGGYMEQFAAALEGIKQPITFVIGGNTRQDSISNALKLLNPNCTKVLVHDAARPFTPPALIANVANSLTDQVKAVIPALPVTDTIKSVASHGGFAPGSEESRKRQPEVVLATLDRAHLRAVQTPQGFARETLETAYRHGIGHGLEATDDAGLVEALGEPVALIPGHEAAMKITTPNDLTIASLLFGGTPVNPQVGIGVDVHAFSDDPARVLAIAGLTWAGERGLDGHSDADVVAHAMCDALLSAAGLGDLGLQFGTDDPQWAGASGAQLLAETARRVRASGARIGNVSVQLIGNRPKLNPRRLEATTALTDAVNAPVSLAATTTDGLGLTGRGEGLAAIATALIYVPFRLMENPAGPLRVA